MVLVWIANAREDVPRTYSILNMILCTLDLILFWLLNSFVSVAAWVLFYFAVIRLGAAILLYFGVKERHMDRCKTWCLIEVVLLLMLILTMIFGWFHVAFLILAIIAIAVRIYGLWYIYYFIKTLQLEVGEDTTIVTNMLPQAVNNLKMKNTAAAENGNTQQI